MLQLQLKTPPENIRPLLCPFQKVLSACNITHASVHNSVQFLCFLFNFFCYFVCFHSVQENTRYLCQYFFNIVVNVFGLCPVLSCPLLFSLLLASPLCIGLLFLWSSVHLLRTACCQAVWKEA